MPIVKANMTKYLTTNVSAHNYSAPAAITLSTSDTSNQKSLVQDGCGSCTLVIAASILVLTFSVALIVHKEKRNPFMATGSEERKTTVQHNSLIIFVLEV